LNTSNAIYESSLQLPSGTLDQLARLAAQGKPRGYADAHAIYKRGEPGAWKGSASDTTLKRHETLKSVIDEIKDKFIVADRRFFNLWKTKLQLSESDVCLVEATEQNKTIETAASIARAGSNQQKWITFGGGLTCDLSAFAASMLNAEIEFVPTTTLGAVDACIGGKTGVNFSGVKNLLGSFWPAKAVHYFTPFFSTLSKYDYLNGGVEGLKLLLLSENSLSAAEYWKTCLDGTLSGEKILELAAAKQQVAGEDFTDQRRRATLNFGHTFGHMIESASLRTNKTIGHGSAVLIGMYLETRLRSNLQQLEESIAGAIKNRMSVDSRFMEDVTSAKDLADISYLQNDKKNSGSQIGFSSVSSTEYNNAYIEYFTEADVRDHLKIRWSKDLKRLV